MRMLTAALGSTLVASAALAAARPSLDLLEARQVMAAAIAAARQDAGTGAIAIVDDGGHVLLLERLDGTFPAASRVSIGKARTSATFRKPSGFFEKVVNDGRTAMAALEDFTPLQGGMPLVIDGQVVGAIGVSGASSAAADEKIAQAAAAALTAPSAPATFFDAASVREAFARGAVLHKPEGPFEIHASRRTAPGQAEVHARQTDVIYVLSGTATFTTGGTTPGAALTAPDELRGSRIEGGTTRALQAGDVVVVPAGTPHQFAQVSGEFLYYVVKVNQ